MAAKKKIGLYVMYDEADNGRIDEAVTISKERGCVTWLSAARLKPGKLEFPTDIIIGIKGDERYFRGLLLAVYAPVKLGRKFVKGEFNHRPSNFRAKDRVGKPVRTV